MDLEVNKETGEIVCPQGCPQTSESPQMPALLDAQAGMTALAKMSDEEFSDRLQSLKIGLNRVEQVKRALMVEGTDYGPMPGVKDQYCLFQPGAQKLCQGFGLVVTFWHNIDYGDDDKMPAISVLTRSFAHLGSKDGPVVAEGSGACNTWEIKYRYRLAKLGCPSCQEELRKSKQDSGFYCWRKTGGCGGTFPANDPRIMNQPRGQVSNPDPWELMNTMVKMAAKRAHVDVALKGTASSGLFSQDYGDPAAPDIAPDIWGRAETQIPPSREPEVAPVRPVESVQSPPPGPPEEEAGPTPPGLVSKSGVTDVTWRSLQQMLTHPVITADERHLYLKTANLDENLKEDKWLGYLKAVKQEIRRRQTNAIENLDTEGTGSDLATAPSEETKKAPSAQSGKSSSGTKSKSSKTSRGSRSRSKS